MQTKSIWNNLPWHDRNKDDGQRYKYILLCSIHWFVGQNHLSKVYLSNVNFHEFIGGNVNLGTYMYMIQIYQKSVKNHSFYSIYFEG